MLLFPNTLYVASTFVLQNKELLPKLLQLIPDTCIANKVILCSGVILQSASDLIPQIVKAGSPLSYLQDVMYGDAELPEGAV